MKQPGGAGGASHGTRPRGSSSILTRDEPTEEKVVSSFPRTPTTAGSDGLARATAGSATTAATANMANNITA
jgi:hypothetical protein